ncbi:MAG: hypothetical protein KUG81_03595 [Gammaproteobacteria bacterium]|nr:hypothetical protein [Gammaproteobacteria bacterium]
MSYSVDEGPVSRWLPGDNYPTVFDQADEFHAWGAQFERTIWHMVCTRLYGWPDAPAPREWVCTMGRAALAGLPQALGLCGPAMGLPAELTKDKRGRYLIQRLCKPQKDGTFCNDADLLEELYAYCDQDVRAEIAISRGLPEMPRTERRVWALTETMNEHGVPVDVLAAAGAVAYVGRAVKALNKQAALVSGGAFQTTGQLVKVREWCEAQGVDMPNLQKATVDKALAGDLPDDVRTVLTAKAAAGLASVKKFKAVATRVCSDGTVKDSQRYHGAATGRFSSVGLQAHNLKRPSIGPDRVAALLGSLATHQTMHGLSYRDGLARLSATVRGVLCAKPRHQFVCSDYSQIELRVLLWLAQDETHLAEIRTGIDPYKSMAADIFGVQYDRVTGDQRQTGKVAVLGCGYQLGAKTFAAYAANFGLDLAAPQCELIVGAYRGKYAVVQKFWYDLQDACIDAISNPGNLVWCRRVAVRTVMKNRFLEILLPSGRRLRYFQPRVAMVQKPWGPATEIQFQGTDTYTRKWGDTSTYGGKLVENVTQGMAADIMKAGMLRSADRGLNPVMTVHDEVVCYVPTTGPDSFTDPLAELNECLLHKPHTLAGLPLEAEGWVGVRYRK